MLAHPGRKNKGAARVGRPGFLLAHPGRKNKGAARVGRPLNLRRGREFCGLNDKKAGARPAFCWSAVR
jgi:hypothetical protein